jgi:hypothetical protein
MLEDVICRHFVDYPIKIKLWVIKDHTDEIEIDKNMYVKT